MRMLLYAAVFTALLLPAIPTHSAPAGLTYVGKSGEPGQISFVGVGYTEPAVSRQHDLVGNPLITGNNLYAPDIRRVGQSWYVYHGGWRDMPQTDDRIYLSVSHTLDFIDGRAVQSQMVTSDGVYHHVNDPSVSHDADGWQMVYTAARFVGSDFRDWINYAISVDGITWTPDSGSLATEVSINDPDGLAGGSITDVARPSIVQTAQGWRMWFDGRTDNGPPHSYLAESVGDDLASWRIIHRYDDVNGFPGFYEPDVVRRPDGTYLAVIQRHFSDLYLATSPDGIAFTLSTEPVLSISDPMVDADYLSNPGLIYDQDTDRLLGVSYGMTDHPTLTGHDIGFAYSQYIIEIRSPDGTWHVQREATGLDSLRIRTHGYNQFDRLRLRNPVTGELLLDVDFSNAVPGDVYRIVIPEPASMLIWMPLMVLFKRDVPGM